MIDRRGRPTPDEIRRVEADACLRELRHDVREIMVPEDLFPVKLICVRCGDSRKVVRE